MKNKIDLGESMSAGLSSLCPYRQLLYIRHKLLYGTLDGRNGFPPGCISMFKCGKGNNVWHIVKRKFEIGLPRIPREIWMSKVYNTRLKNNP